MAPAKSLRVSTGNGHLRYKRDDSLVAAHFPSRLSVDHEVTYPCDVQWWVKGEWVLTRRCALDQPLELADLARTLQQDPGHVAYALVPCGDVMAIPTLAPISTR